MRVPVLLAVLASLVIPGCGGGSADDGKAEFAFITNCVDPFWTIAEAGMNDAAEEFGVRATFHAPADGTVEEQKRFVEQALARNVKGLAITLLDAVNQVPLVNEAASRTNVVTHDSDAPTSERLCYVGCNNYNAGREVGKLVKKALPDGGRLMLFIGNLEQDNSRLRRQGVIDELLGRSNDPTRFDEAGEVPQDGPWKVLDTRTDSTKAAQAKANAEDALARHPDLDGMVGLFAYNPPACLAAVSAAGKLDQVKIIGFDEDQATLRGIVDGHVYGTVSQDPYQYGYHAIRILAALDGGDRSVLPDDGIHEVKGLVVTKDNVAEFWATLNERLGIDPPKDV